MPPEDESPVSETNLHGLDLARHQFLAEVASAYYVEDKTQSEIAQELGVSRSSVSRLLTEARDRGIIDITIRWPHASASDLSLQIQKYFGIEEVHIITTGRRGYTQVVEILGNVAAQMLERRLRDHMTLGISWNNGVYQVVRAFRAARKMEGRVVQLTGSSGISNPLLDGPDLARWLAQILGSRYVYLPSPLMVDSKATREALLSDRVIAETIDMGRNADIVLVGIGSVFPPLCNLRTLGYISDDELEAITREGAVGEILTTFYDINGNILDLPLHERIIGLPLEELRNINCVIGVAAGAKKAQAIVGALRGGFLTCLVTDDTAAREMVRYMK